MRRLWFTALALVLTTTVAQAADVVVFAAASLKNALDSVTTEWTAETGKTAAVSYAASSALAKQIEQDAPADLFLSADVDWMDYLSERNLVDNATRQELLGNQLVLIATGANVPPIAIAPDFDLRGALKGGHLAMADVSAVPAGRYGRAALESLGVWISVEDSVAQAENVRAALALVSRGEAPLGIVYATDAKADKGVSVVGTFPEDSHPPIIYPIALTAKSSNQDARSLYDFILSPKAAKLFEAQGFSRLE